jgi:hypothetical protein
MDSISFLSLAVVEAVVLVTEDIIPWIAAEGNPADFFAAKPLAVGVLVTLSISLLSRSCDPKSPPPISTAWTLFVPPQLLPK